MFYYLSPTFNNFLNNHFSNFSMFAEIGGYSGIFIGFSLLDLSVIVKYVIGFLKHD